MTFTSVQESIQSIKKVVSSNIDARFALRQYIEHEVFPVHNSSSFIGSTAVVQNKSNRLPTNTPFYAHEYLDTGIEALTDIAFRSNSLFAYVSSDIEYVRKESNVVVPLGTTTYMTIQGINDFYYTLCETLIPNAVKKSCAYIVDKLEDNGFSTEACHRELHEGFERLYKETDLPDLLRSNSMVELVGYSRRVVSDAELRNLLNSEEFKRRFIGNLYNEIDTLFAGIVNTRNVDDLEGAASRNDEVHIHAGEFLIINVSVLDRAVESGLFTTRQSVLQYLSE